MTEQAKPIDIIPPKMRIALPAAFAGAVIAVVATIPFNFHKTIGIAKQAIHAKPYRMDESYDNISEHLREDYMPAAFGAAALAGLIGLGVDQSRYKRRLDAGQITNEPPIMTPAKVGLAAGTLIGVLYGGVHYRVKMHDVSERAERNQVEAIPLYTKQEDSKKDGLSGALLEQLELKAIDTKNKADHFAQVYKVEEAELPKDVSQWGVIGGVVGSISGAVLRRRKEEQELETQR